MFELWCNLVLVPVSGLRVENVEFHRVHVSAGECIKGHPKFSFFRICGIRESVDKSHILPFLIPAGSFICEDFGK